MAATGCSAQRSSIDRTTVASLDVKRYMGTWYEIARYDHSFERNMERCKAQYTLLPDGKIVVVYSGYNSRTGRYKTSVGKAKAGESAGQLRVSFFWFFYSDYNILALDANYDWALIGSRSPKYQWILARTPSLSGDDRTYHSHSQGTWLRHIETNMGEAVAGLTHNLLLQSAAHRPTAM